MDALRLARLIAVGRIGFGLGLIAAPERLTAPWLGRDAARAGTQVASRGLGARDLALGLGALVAPEKSLQPWMVGALMGDGADLLATLAAGDALPLRGRALVSLIAAGGFGAGVVALAGLRGRTAQAAPAA